MEAKPAAKYDPSEGMSEDQLRNFVRFLFEMLETAKAHLASVEKILAEVKGELKSANGVIGSQAKGMERLNLQVVELNAQLRESNRLVNELTSLNAKLVGELTILKSDHFGTSKSRKGQGVRKEVIGKNDGCDDANIKSLQSDGYNVYKYLDDELVDIEHLCCLAHAQNKFKDALRCGCEQAYHFNTFWTQLFRYRDDGDYSIDNMAAERAIRPMTVQRKNSLFYCSTNGATRSAVYNTFIETCRSLGISFRQYFEKLIIEMNKGRTDYENLLPMTISLNNK